MPRVIFKGLGKEATIKRGDTPLDAALKCGVILRSSCGGKSLCGKCEVIVEKGLGNITMPKGIEVEEGSKKRFACVSRVFGDVVIRTSKYFEDRYRILHNGIVASLEIKPAIDKVPLHLGLAKDNILMAVKRKAKKDFSFNLKALRGLSLSKGNVTVVFSGDELMDVEKGDTHRRCFGIAFDIGTTTIVGYLVDLFKGEILDSYSIVNPQTLYGDDVMSRLTYASESPKNLEDIHRKLIHGLDKIISRLCDGNGVGRKEIYEACVVGNTTMHHLLLKLNPKRMSIYPYTPVFENPMNVNSKELKVNINSGANIYVLPPISAFMGPDIVGVILSTGMNTSEELTLAIDIGTNCEIVLGNREGIYGCSTPAGPVFEGGHIKHGTGAMPGAIEKVKLAMKNGDLRVDYITIGNLRPRGICGSGIVDSIAEMYRNGIIDRGGRMNDYAFPSRMMKKEFVIAGDKESDTGEVITITQKDIREIQLAKAAIFAGIVILMRERGVKVRDIDKILVAGAFGNYIDPKSALAIGMYPSIDLEKIEIVGNAAGMGAVKALLSMEERDIAKKIASEVKYITLAKHKSFELEFINAMDMP